MLMLEARCLQLQWQGYSLISSDKFLAASKRPPTPLIITSNRKQPMTLNSSHFTLGSARTLAAIAILGSAVLICQVRAEELGFEAIVSKVRDAIASGLEHKYVTEAVSFNEYMEGAAIVVRSGFPHISFLDLCGSILSCFAYKKNVMGSKSWFESLLSCTLMQFGGTTLTGWLLGQTPSWIVSHTAFPALLVAWWLTFCCPFDAFYRLLSQNSLGLLVLGTFSAISGGHAVTSWGVDKAANNAFHVNYGRISQSVLTCIACGTLSASGGGVLCNIFRFYDSSHSYTLSATPSILIAGNYGASATITRSFYLACIYYMLVNQHLYCPWSYQASLPFARLVIGVLQVLHFFLSTYLSIDIFQKFSILFVHHILCISPTVGATKTAIKKENAAVNVVKVPVVEKDSKKKESKKKN